MAWTPEKSFVLLEPKPAGYDLQDVSSVWMAASKTSLDRLDVIQRRAVNIIAMPEASLSRNAIQPRAQRREVGALTLFH